MFKLADVARATNVPARMLSDWLARKLVDIPGGGTGNHRVFGQDDVYKIALIVELTRLGVSVSEAAKAASAFSDDANGDRDASTLFPSGKTILLVDADGARCINILDRGAFEAAMETVYGDTYGVIGVNLSTLVANVDRALAGSRKPMPPAGAIFRNGRQLMT